MWRTSARSDCGWGGWVSQRANLEIHARGTDTPRWRASFLRLADVGLVGGSAPVNANHIETAKANES